MNDLMNRSVLVTGASTGIGEACAMELDRRGVRSSSACARKRMLKGFATRLPSGLVPLIST